MFIYLASIYFMGNLMVKVVDIKIKGYRCERCGHEWAPKKEGNSPRVCPKCKSPYWDTPRKDKK